MKREDAAQLANDLLLKHAPDHVIYEGWKFGGFDRAKKRYGQCNYADRVITLSGHFVDHGPDEEIRQTILHEVAHVLAGPGTGHGPEWLAKARSIGYTGKRTKNVPLPAHTDYVWIGRCGNGCKVGYHRKPGKRVLTFGACTKHLGRITWTNTRTGEVINE